MESSKEVELFSQLSTVSIENLKDTFIVHLRPLLEIASTYEPPNSQVSKAVGVVPRTEVLSVVQFFPPKAPIATSEHRLTVEEQPVEIVIEQPLDDTSLGKLLELLGNHSPASLSHTQKGNLFGLLKENPSIVSQLNFKKTGIRIIFRIPEQTFIPLYGLPPLHRHFTGREQELTRLRSFPDEDKKILQIAGTGGIGKSQFANYYARSEFNNKCYEWIIWLNGGDLQKISDSLSSQFVELGRALGLPVNQLKGDPLYLRIYEKLGEKGRGLVVIDDAPNYKVLKTFLPESFGRWNMDVLITTRNGQTFGPLIRKFIVDVFSLEDAKCYIHRFLKETHSEQDIEVLARTLDCYPLILSTSMITLPNEKLSIVEEQCAQAYQSANTKVKTIMKEIVQLSLEQVKILCKSEDAFERAMRVLTAASFIAPEVAIPKVLLGKWLPEDEGEIFIEEVLDVLRAQSLVEDDKKKATYRIHKAVQDVVRSSETFDSAQKKLMQWNEIIESSLSLTSSSKRGYQGEQYALFEAHSAALSEHLSLIKGQDKRSFNF